MIRSSEISFVAAFQERDTMEGDRRPKRRMQEKKVSIQLFFLVPFDLPFLSNAILKKSIDETKKNVGYEKVFISFPSTFF